MNSRPSAVWRMNQFRIGTPEGGLRGFRCPEGHVHLAPRPVCPECAAAALLAMVEEQQSAELAIPVEFPTSVALLADVEL